jgi:hypothetical protein
MTTAGCAYAACVSCAWVHAGSPRESKRRAPHLSPFVPGVRRGRSVPRAVRAIPCPFWSDARAHAVRATRLERSQDRAGGRGRGPIQSVPHDSPDSSRVLQERSEDAKGSPASVSASSLATALLFVFFLVLSSPEPLFFFRFFCLGRPSGARGLCCRLRPLLPSWLCPGVCLRSGVGFGFFVRLRLRRSGERFHEARVVPRVPFPGRPC